LEGKGGVNWEGLIRNWPGVDLEFLEELFFIYQRFSNPSLGKFKQLNFNPNLGGIRFPI